MNAQLIHLAPIHVAMIRHTGPYEELSPVFDELWDWVTRNGVPAERTIGIYWDNPDYVRSLRLRSAACVEIPAGYLIPHTGGLAITVEDIVGGSYMTTRFVGPYEDLAPIWTELTSYTERLGYTITQNPAFEVYVNDASTTPPSQLITELYMPVK